MSVSRSAMTGAAWFAAGSWVQLVFSLVSFVVVVRHVEPALVGAFNAGAVITAFIDTVVGPSLSLSLGQRESIKRRHVDATFWIALMIALVLVVAIMLGGRELLTAMNAPDGWPLLMAVATVWPLTIITSVFSSLLSRDLRFAEQGRIAMVAGLLGSIASIATIASGGGVWALVAGDMTFRITKFCGIARARRYRPGWPRDLGAIRDLLSFNLMTLATLVLTFLDLATPRLLTSYLLGPAALGYLALAWRCLDLLSQLTLYPISSVMMVSIARLNRDLVAMRQLIRRFYRIATAVAYPAFLGAIMLAPHLVWLVGPRWTPAIATMQILLLVGLRNTTGLFTTGILQGTARLGGSILMLVCGIALQVVLVPLGADFGPVGVTTAILVRTLATWPLGCWLVRRATGMPIIEQLAPGRAPLIAGLAMCGAIAAARLLVPEQLAYVDLIVSAGIGAITYSLVLLSLDRPIRVLAREIAGDVRQGNLAVVRQRILAALTG